MADPSSITLRVRYCECDPMGVAHHSVYPVWLEMARTEALRGVGMAYRDLEARGVFFVVIDLALKYRRPARYDDELTIVVEAATPSRVRLEHTYKVQRDGELLATGQTTLACVNHAGRVQSIPDDVWASLTGSTPAD
jgi:acyl-CoA thioester hydrolase